MFCLSLFITILNLLFKTLKFIGVALPLDIVPLHCKITYNPSELSFFNFPMERARSMVSPDLGRACVPLHPHWIIQTFFISNFPAGRDAQMLNILIFEHLKNNASFFFILKSFTIYPTFCLNLFITILNLLFKTLKLIGIALSFNNVCFAL